MVKGRFWVSGVVTYQDGTKKLVVILETEDGRRVEKARIEAEYTRVCVGDEN